MNHPASLATAAALVLASSASLPIAASEVQDAYYAHQKLCIRLFFSDQAAHAEQCLPNTSPNLPAHAGSTDHDVVKAPSAPVAPVDPTPPDDGPKG